MDISSTYEHIQESSGIDTDAGLTVKEGLEASILRELENKMKTILYTDAQ